MASTVTDQQAELVDANTVKAKIAEIIVDEVRRALKRISLITNWDQTLDWRVRKVIVEDSKEFRKIGCDLLYVNCLGGNQIATASYLITTRHILHSFPHAIAHATKHAAAHIAHSLVAEMLKHHGTSSDAEFERIEHLRNKMYKDPSMNPPLMKQNLDEDKLLLQYAERIAREEEAQQREKEKVDSVIKLNKLNKRRKRQKQREQKADWYVSE